MSPDMHANVKSESQSYLAFSCLCRVYRPVKEEMGRHFIRTVSLVATFGGKGRVDEIKYQQFKESCDID